VPYLPEVRPQGLKPKIIESRFPRPWKGRSSTVVRASWMACQRYSYPAALASLRGADECVRRYMARQQGFA